MEEARLKKLKEFEEQGADEKGSVNVEQDEIVHDSSKTKGNLGVIVRRHSSRDDVENAATQSPRNLVRKAAINLTCICC